MILLLGLVFLPCIGCQGFSFDLNFESVNESHDLNRKLFDQVPSVKDLLLDARVQAYLEQQPYIYGLSADGKILAILSYRKSRQSYRLDFYQLAEGKNIQTLYLPSQTELEALMHSENGDEILEYINIVQEAIERGYQIKKPVKPILLVPQTRYILSKDKGWYVRPVQDDGHLNLIIENWRKERWTIFRQDLGVAGSGQVFSYLVPFTENDSSWTFVIFMMGEKAEDNVVRHLNDKILSSIPFDKELEQACNHILTDGKEDCRLAFRHDEQNPWYLLVKGRQEESTSTPGSYRGRVDQFLILNEKKEVLVKGTGTNLIDAGQSFRLSRQAHGYRLQVNNSGQDRVELLAVDVLDQKQKSIQKLVWRWNFQQNHFQLVGGNWE